MRLAKTKTLLASAALVASSFVGISASPAAFAATSCTGCEGAQFTGDGVRIHSCASLSCTTLGLGYRSNTARVLCANTPYKNNFWHIDDLTTGVTGWVYYQYILAGCD